MKSINAKIVKELFNIAAPAAYIANYLSTEPLYSGNLKKFNVYVIAMWYQTFQFLEAAFTNPHRDLFWHLLNSTNKFF